MGGGIHCNMKGGFLQLTTERVKRFACSINVDLQVVIYTEQTRWVTNIGEKFPGYGGQQPLKDKIVCYSCVFRVCCWYIDAFSCPARRPSTGQTQCPEFLWGIGTIPCRMLWHRKRLHAQVSVRNQKVTAAGATAESRRD